jgi:hypothetical protein
MVFKISVYLFYFVKLLFFCFRRFIFHSFCLWHYFCKITNWTKFQNSTPFTFSFFCWQPWFQPDNFYNTTSRTVHLNLKHHISVKLPYFAVHMLLVIYYLATKPEGWILTQWTTVLSKHNLVHTFKPYVPKDLL